MLLVRAISRTCIYSKMKVFRILWYLHRQQNQSTLIHAETQTKICGNHFGENMCFVFVPGPRWLMSTSSPSSRMYALASPSSTM